MRFAIGPWDAQVATERLGACVAAGVCRAVADWGEARSWSEFRERLAGFEPECLVVWLAYRNVPDWLWDAPVPVIGLAADWNLLWHGYRDALARCDAVVTDRPGVERLRAAGVTHAVEGILYGGEAAWSADGGERERDIDVLFVGNLHGAVQRERLAWLRRLARLGERHRVVIRSGVFGEQYRSLMRRARIAFNRSIRGEWNLRVCESLASGAVLFQEAGNAEVASRLTDGVACVFYDERNFESLVERTLADEPARAAMAQRGRERAEAFRFERFLAEIQTKLEADWDAIVARSKARIRPSMTVSLRRRVWQRISCDQSDDATLAGDLVAALAAEPASAELHLLRGVVEADRATTPGAAFAAAEAFRLAALHRQGFWLATLNRAESLILAQRPDDAMRELDALRAEVLAGAPGDASPLPHVPVKFDDFRVAWEAAAWRHAGEVAAENAEKRRVVTWRCHLLRHRLGGSIEELWAAVALAPELPSGQRALGEALLALGRPLEAIAPLRRAWEANPFRVDLASLLRDALHGAKRLRDVRRLAREMRLLAKANPDLAPADWFAHETPVGDELASVVIPCWNQVGYTRQCVESLVRCTHTPIELILVDNGSTDETPEFLAKLASDPLGNPHVVRVTVVRNDANRGFAVACNQGLREARGEYLVLLNNDTIVTQGWLERLVDWSLVNHPKIGLVGPASNGAPPPQLVPMEFSDVASLEVFAERRRVEHGERAVVVERLTGFCVLFRRDVLASIGFLDEQFGWGFFEDDDLCVRVRERGHELLFAPGVFVHHYGSRSMAQLPVPAESLLRENHSKFAAKWGDDLASRYRLFAPPAATPPASDSHVSLCMIVKNEEDNLGECLASVAGLVDEIVVVDTGSTDRTKEIAVSFGAKLFDFPWIDDFAAARNESLRHATGDWVFWMDADDRLDAAARDAFARVRRSLDPNLGGYVMKCLCLPEKDTGTTTVVDHVRLFRRQPEVRWRYRIHEQILPSLRQLGLDVRWTDVVIHHTGYQDPAVKLRKRSRDLKILEAENRDRPDDPFTLFNLGQVLQEEGKLDEALGCFRRSLALSHPSDSIVRKLHALVVQILRRQGRTDEALRAVADGKTHYADDPELLFQEGLCRQDASDWPGAERAYRAILAGTNAKFFGSADPGIRGFKARHNLGVVLREQKRDAEAEEQWTLALAESPTFLASHAAFADLHLARSDWPAFDASLATLRALPGGPYAASLLDARRALADRRFADAERTLAECVSSRPTDLLPRVLLSHVHLHAENFAAAERALRDVLALAPNHAEATNNLEILLARRARNR